LAARSAILPHRNNTVGVPSAQIFLSQHTDLKSRKTIKNIVDGQQRTSAIYDFYTGALRLAKKIDLREAAGKKYEQLPDELKGRFLTYQLSIDLFVATDGREIRQAFRRLNSYTVPLNPEELRHAEYQGAFKWLIYDLTESTEERLLDFGVFGTKQMIRMHDAKLWTEFMHALEFGIKTTKAKDLNQIYQRYDKSLLRDPSVPSRSDASDAESDAEVARKRSLVDRVESALSCVADMPELHGGPLMRHHVFYSLLLAITQMQLPVPTLDGLFNSVPFSAFDRGRAVTNLSKLAAAIESEDAGEFEEFRLACSEKTNVDAQRRKRVAFLGRALQPNPL
jgi:hypothetical protein